MTGGKTMNSPIYARERERYSKMTQINKHLFSAVQKHWVDFVRQNGAQMLSIEASHWQRWEEVFGSDEAVRTSLSVAIA